MTTLTWLHLSDWHQKGKDFDRQVVRDALIKDIANRTEINPDLERMDFIVFSGDLAFSGESAEYETAKRELLDQILENVGLEPSRLFIVPGNHDLDRGHIYEMLPPGLHNSLCSDAEVQTWLTDDRKRERVLEPFGAYSAFVSGYTGQPTPEYATIRTWTCGGKQVALLGLNSAWMCARNKDVAGEVNDYGYALLGEPQIHDALAQIAGADVRIAILHHPFDWLAPFDRNRVEARLGRECHFILRGHEHQPQVKVIQGTGGDCIIIPAGACYKRRIAEDPRYTNAYNWVYLNFETGQGTVYLRRWSDPRNEWIEDTDAHLGGKFDFQLPTRLRAEKPLISGDLILVPGDNQMTILVMLQEWKTVHTQMQSLLDQLNIVANRLSRCQSEPMLLQPNLYVIEESWSQCVPKIRAISLVSFVHIGREPIIKSVQRLASRVRDISRQIASASTLPEARTVEIEIRDVKEEVATALSVADRQIVELVDKLAHNGAMR